MNKLKIIGERSYSTMKILIICSKAFYKDIAPIKEELEKAGHEIELPNSYNNPDAEKESWEAGSTAHSEFKAKRR